MQKIEFWADAHLEAGKGRLARECDIDWEELLRVDFGNRKLKAARRTGRRLANHPRQPPIAQAEVVVAVALRHVGCRARWTR